MKPLSVRALAAALAIAVLTLVSGCASGPHADPRDPLEPFNRGVYAFNDGLDRAVLKPVAQTYVDVVPSFVRTGVNNFFNNLSDAWSAVNSALQLKGQAAVDNLFRVQINTLFGLGGLIDIASDANIERHSEDFGQTLGHWGVPSGPYLVLPVLGSSTLRDAAVLPVETVGNGVTYIDPESARWWLYGLRAVDARAGLLRVGTLLDDAAAGPLQLHARRLFAEAAERRLRWQPPRQRAVRSGPAACGAEVVAYKLGEPGRRAGFQTCGALCPTQWRIEPMLNRRNAVRVMGACALVLTHASMGLAWAADEAPDEMIKRLSTDVLNTIKSDPAMQGGDVGKIIALVDGKVMPNVNFLRMTASAVGPAWRQATPEQRQKLQDEFKVLLVRTYSGALSQVSDQEIVVRPLRAAAEDKEVMVRHRGARPGRPDPARLPAREDAGPGGRLEDLQPERAGRLVGRDLPQPVRAGDQHQGHRWPDRQPGAAQQDQQRSQEELMLVLPAELTHTQAMGSLQMLLQGLAAQKGPVLVDAAALTRFDSSALAVLLQCRREALGQGRGFAVRGLPQRLRDLAVVYGVGELVPAAPD